MAHWMLVLLIFIGALTFVVVLVLLSSIHVRATFTQQGGDVEGTVVIRALYGIVRIRRRLKELNTKSTDDGLAVEAVTASQQAAQHGNQEAASGPLGSRKQDEKSTLTASEVLATLRRMPEYYHTFLAAWPIARRVLCRVRVPVLCVSLRVGLGDPVVTGYAVGVAWAALGTVVGGISSLVMLTDRPEINVEADFHSMALQTEARCIGHIKVGYAILGALHMLRVWSRVRGTNDDTTSPRSEEEETWSTPSRG